MKIAITGHTSGIGKCLYNLLTAQGHEVVGFSRSNGYDLAVPATVGNIVKQAKDYDVFINNAYYNLTQVDLMYALDVFWKDNKSKTHVVVGSRSADGIFFKASPYAVMKSAIDNAALQLQVASNYRLINVKPGYTNTPMTTGPNSRVKNIPNSLIEPEDLAEFISQLISHTKFKVLNVTIDPI